MKILVAEDNPDSRYLLQQLLTGAGHTVAAFADGAAALAALPEVCPDAVVSDGLMPGMDGFRFCRAIKQHPRFFAVPFIFYTATYTDEGDERFALSLGADRFIVKPADPERLVEMIIETVKQLKARPPSAPASALDDPAVLEEYSRRLSLKLELKVAELSAANEGLRQSEQAVRALNERLVETVRALEMEVAERQAAEAALRVQGELLRHAQRLGHIGSWERKADSEVMVWSEETYRIFGVDPSEFVPTLTWIRERLHEADRARVLAALQLSDESAADLESEHRIVRPDGVVRHVIIRRQFLTDAVGRPARIVGTVQDVTERKLGEEQRARLEAQLRQAQKMEAIGNLAGGIAHDFNNILTAIMAHAELLELELPRTGGAHLRESVTEILTASSRARDVVKQILTFSRKQAVERRRLSIGTVVQDALKLVRATLPPSVEVRADIAIRRAVMANESQVHQIVLNLVTNAAQALGEKGGLIEVKLTLAPIDEATARLRPPLRVADYARLDVRDSGCGMEPSVLERVFEPFFTTKSVGQGTGLGLAVVHGIVQAHDGAVFVESSPGQGTTFSVYLPTVSGEVREKGTGSSSPHPGNGQKILFVDDEPSVSKIGARLLERLGYTAVSLTDPVAARDRLVSNPTEFELVITDYLMPRVNGLDLAKAAWAVRPDLPMILAVGFGGQLDARKAKAHGFREFLAKPFAIQTLADAITRARAK